MISLVRKRQMAYIACIYPKAPITQRNKIRKNRIRKFKVQNKRIQRFEIREFKDSRRFIETMKQLSINNKPEIVT